MGHNVLRGLLMEFNIGKRKQTPEVSCLVLDEFFKDIV